MYPGCGLAPREAPRPPCKGDGLDFLVERNAEMALGDDREGIAAAALDGRSAQGAIGSRTLGG